MFSLDDLLDPFSSSSSSSSSISSLSSSSASSLFHRWLLLRLHPRFHLQNIRILFHLAVIF